MFRFWFNNFFIVLQISSLRGVVLKTTVVLLIQIFKQPILTKHPYLWFSPFFRITVTCMHSYGDVTIPMYIYSALMPIKKWGFCSVPHLLWHGTPVHNAERLAPRLSLPILTTWVCRGRDSKTQPSACKANAPTDCATARDFFNFCFFKCTECIAHPLEKGLVDV